jgi:hypothetical protein
VRSKIVANYFIEPIQFLGSYNVLLLAILKHVKVLQRQQAKIIWPSELPVHKGSAGHLVVGRAVPRAFEQVFVVGGVTGNPCAPKHGHYNQPRFDADGEGILLGCTRPNSSERKTIADKGGAAPKRHFHGAPMVNQSPALVP